MAVKFKSAANRCQFIDQLLFYQFIARHQKCRKWRANKNRQLIHTILCKEFGFFPSLRFAIRYYLDCYKSDIVRVSDRFKEIWTVTETLLFVDLYKCWVWSEEHWTDEMVEKMALCTAAWLLKHRKKWICNRNYSSLKDDAQAYNHDHFFAPFIKHIYLNNTFMSTKNGLCLILPTITGTNWLSAKIITWVQSTFGLNAWPSHSHCNSSSFWHNEVKAKHSKVENERPLSFT